METIGVTASAVWRASLRRAMGVRSRATLGLTLRVTAMVFAGGFLACGQLLGLDAEPEVSRSNTPAETHDASARQSCLLSSECPDTPQREICVFKLCSPPCATDKDCSLGQRCLETDDGLACVANVRAECAKNAECPAGSECLAGLCRNACVEAGACRSDQVCNSGACVGVDENAVDASVPPGSGSQDDGPGPDEPDAQGPTLAPDQSDTESTDTESTSSSDSGAPAQPDGQCTPNARRCEDGRESRCDADGRWSTPEDCAYACVGDECGGTCVPDSHGCEGDDVQRCNAQGAWALDEQCDVTCELGQCVSSCTDDVMDCSGKRPRICVDGAWVTEDECPYGCVMGECSGECAPSSKACREGRLATCGASGQWNDGVECAYLCVDDACGGQCKPFTTRCLNPTTVQTCDADGQWGSEDTCEFICDEDADECGGQCVPGVTQCSDDETEQTCGEDGTWGDDRVCARGCVVDTCAEGCGVGTKRCSDDKSALETCVAGDWQSADCDFVCVGQQCGGECVPGTTQCFNGSTQQTCSSTGQWGADLVCSHVCTGAACGGVCDPMEKKCLDDDTEQECDAEGQWTIERQCSGVCQGDTCTGDCTPESTQCLNGSTQQTCDANGEWGDDLTCDHLCVGDACGGECDPDDVECLDGEESERTCGGDGLWGDPVACDFVCLTGGCGGECVPGDTCTSSTEIDRCSADGVLTHSTCSAPLGGLACYMDACTGTCVPTTQSCVDNQPKICGEQGLPSNDGSACMSPDTICKVVQGDAQCVANPPYYVGEHAQLSSQDSGVADIIFAIPITFSARTRILKYGVVLRGAGVGAGNFLRAALYTSSNSAPATKLGQSLEANPSGAGEVLMNPESALIVDAGSYWLAVIFKGTIPTWVESGSGTTRYASASYASGPPNSFGASTSVSARQNFFVQVQDQP